MGMRVLLAGKGGSAHALAWKLASSAVVDRIECAGLNTGVARFGRCYNVDPADAHAVAEIAERTKASVVIPLKGLATGIADVVAMRGIPVFGPVQAAAQLEGSKAYLRLLAEEAGVPSPGFQIFPDPPAALKGLGDFSPPYVVKASGQASSSGVQICLDRPAAETAVYDVITHRHAGIVDTSVVVEEYLSGAEASLFAVSDGSSLRMLSAARDHKRLLDHDKGPNTGGMGAFSPVRETETDCGQLAAQFLTPILSGLQARGIRFVGVLYAGLILTKDGWRLLELNVRLGDPEAQVILPRVSTDLGLLVREAVAGRLHQLQIHMSPTTYVSVALTAAGYPGDTERNNQIFGLGNAEGHPDVLVFHGGMTVRDGRLVTTKGRIMHVVGTGADLMKARDTAYSAAAEIRFDGKHFRADIGSAGHDGPTPW